jgi:hypothetical protein
MRLLMSKNVAFLALVCLLLTSLWIALLIADMASAGPLETFEQAAAHASRLHGLFYATYLNAALLTLSAVAFFAALHAWLKPTAPDWTLIGLVFVPIYGTLNLVVYLSQVTLIPALVTLRLDPQTTVMADTLLRLTLQAWPGSIMAFFNGLAYAVLGIPSILYGALLWQHTGALRWGGLLLALNGAACILGVVGSLAGSALLSQGVMIGGILFLLALFPLGWAFSREIQ